MSWVNNLNSTNWKIFAGVSMAHIVVVTACAMEVAGAHFNEIILLELLTFIAAWAGISYAQFAKQRTTEIISAPKALAENTSSTTVTTAALTSGLEVPPQVQPGISGVLRSRDRRRTGLEPDD